MRFVLIAFSVAVLFSSYTFGIRIGKTKEIESRFELIECTEKAITGLFDNDTELRIKFQIFASVVKQSKVDRNHCYKTENPQRCLEELWAQVSQHFIDFKESVEDKNEILAIEMKALIKTHCNRENLLGRFEYYIQVMDELSIANGEEELWSKCKTKLNNHLITWTNCPTVGCQRREFAAIYFLLEDFKQMIKTKNPKMLKEYERKVLENCNNGFNY